MYFLDRVLCCVYCNGADLCQVLDKNCYLVASWGSSEESTFLIRLLWM